MVDRYEYNRGYNEAVTVTERCTMEQLQEMRNKFDDTCLDTSYDKGYRKALYERAEKIGMTFKQDDEDVAAQHIKVTAVKEAIVVGEIAVTNIGYDKEGYTPPVGSKYWGVVDSGTIKFTGTHKECWDALVELYPHQTMTTLKHLGIKIKRVN